MAEYQCGQKANQKTADAATEHQIRKIINQTASQNQHCDKDLTKIVGKTAADTDCGRTKTAELFYKQHGKQTECCTGKAVEKHGKITEGKCCKKNTY